MTYPPPEITARSRPVPAPPSEDLVDAALIQAVLRGERAAINEFGAKILPYIRSTVYRVLHGCVVQRNKPHLDDLVQDVVELLFSQDQKALRKFDPARGTFRTFLFVFTRSRTVDRLRALSGGIDTEFASVEELALWASKDPSLFEQSAFKHGMQRLYELLRQELNELQLAVLERTLDGCSGDEIATALATTAGNVFTIRMRNRELMSKLWVQVFGEPPDIKHSDKPHQPKHKTRKSSDNQDSRSDDDDLNG